MMAGKQPHADKMEILQVAVSGHSATKLEIKNSKFEKKISIWKVKHILKTLG